MSDDQQQAPDDAIQTLVARLARPAPGGRQVIERAAIMAEGTTSGAILDWLAAAAWVPEDLPAQDAGGSGLHGRPRDALRGQTRRQPPRRYVSPPA